MPPSQYKKHSQLRQPLEATIGDKVVGLQDILPEGETESDILLSLTSIRNLFDYDSVYHRRGGEDHFHNDEFSQGMDLEDWFPILPSTYAGAPQSNLANHAFHVLANGTAGAGADPTTSLIAWVLPLSGISGGCMIETSCRAIANDEPAAFQGLVMSDGLLPGSDEFVAAGIFYGHESPNQPYVATYKGQLDDLTITAYPILHHIPGGRIHIRLFWSADNTWGVYFSADGWVYHTLGVAPISHTMTPTHYGFAYGITEDIRGVFTFEYFRNVLDSTIES